MYEIKSKKDQLHIQKEDTIRRIQENQEKINQLSEDSKELRSENEIVKTKIEQKLQSNPLVKELEDQKEKLSKEISAVKAQIDEARKAFNKKMEDYD
jgi:flagellar biosynthesis chaperone FliJ